MKILIACEESQTVCKEFRKLGHSAFSCDLKNCSGGYPEWHIRQDIKTVIDGWIEVVELYQCKFENWDQDKECPICPKCKIDYSECYHPGPGQDDLYEYKMIGNKQYGKLKNFNWDMLIAFPPCTHLASSGAKHFVKKIKNGKQQEAIDFFLMFTKTNIEKVCIENPIGIMSTLYKKPTQIIQPYYFGDEVQKATCLWLKNLPKLFHAEKKDLFNDEVTHVSKGKFVVFKSGKKMHSFHNKDKNQGRRSKTFLGIAKAMSLQWGSSVSKNNF